MSTTTSVLQTQTIADISTDWTQSVAFAQFDPSLGTLVDVRLGISGDVVGTVSVENLGPAAAAVTVYLPVNIDLYGPDSVGWGGLQVDPTTTVNLGGYDGTADYTGTSGTVVGGITTTGATVVVDSSDFTGFIGTGTATLTAASLGNAIETGDANLLSTLRTEAGAVVSVQYDYVAGGSPSGSGSSFDGGVFYEAFGNIGTPGSTFANSITTVAQTLTVPGSTAGWTSSLNVTQFDPSLGMLEAVDVILNGNVVGTISAENLGDTTIQFNTTQAADILLGLAGTLTASVPLSVSNNMTLAPFDGTQDFGGPSGGTDSGLGNSFSFSGSETDPSILAAFTGTGVYAVPISSAPTSIAQGGANLVSQLNLDAGATVEISYVYSPVACFAAGTRIETSDGAIPVERLRVGQRVQTLSGRDQAIEWIGYRTVDCRRHPAPERVQPVRIDAHAFGENRPGRGLFLSPDHSVFVEGVLVPVKFLINGTTISQIPVASITYYHLELSCHDVVLAEGLPCESYLDTGGRSAFENGGGATQLHPEFAPDEARVGMVWRNFAYAPLIGDEAHLEQIRTRLAVQAALLGVRAA